MIITRHASGPGGCGEHIVWQAGQLVGVLGKVSFKLVEGFPSSTSVGDFLIMSRRFCLVPRNCQLILIIGGWGINTF